ncbi:MAG: methyltransferase domain-containing protein [Zetaproteobacteria bacterium]|nr:methyltransferase domain-containing protein [Zetaproteobacteria bacterium]
MKKSPDELRDVLIGMNVAFSRGENAMAWARKHTQQESNHLFSTLVAYDLQAGDYVKKTLKSYEENRQWCMQIADLLSPYLEMGSTLLEVGVGEATTLAGVMKELQPITVYGLGLDISWSRIHIAHSWCNEEALSAELFVGDMFNIPLEDDAVDVIYSSHSLEPNGGMEDLAIKELLRVARKVVVLVEPIFELASKEAQSRMAEHGYIRNLKSAAEKTDATIRDYRLLELTPNSLNPSGVLLLEKGEASQKEKSLHWKCPLTGGRLMNEGDVFFNDQFGIAYPILRGIPMLHVDHAIIASKLKKGD